MLSPTDLKLFEILDEFLDKSLTFGCVVEMANYYWREEQGENLRGHHITKIDNQKIEDLYIIANHIAVSKITKVIGHRPTLSTTLQYLGGKTYEIKTNGNVLKIIAVLPEYRFINFIRNLTTELQCRPEEKKQELLLFLQSIQGPTQNS